MGFGGGLTDVVVALRVVVGELCQLALLQGYPPLQRRLLVHQLTPSRLNAPCI
jgi:hypothetical protein